MRPPAPAVLLTLVLAAGACQNGGTGAATPAPSDAPPAAGDALHAVLRFVEGEYAVAAGLAAADQRRVLLAHRDAVRGVR